MEFSYITIENIKGHHLETNLGELINLYAETGFVDHVPIHRKKGEPENFLVNFPNQPDFDRFCYFVNYLHYPAKEQGSNPKVSGYFRLKTPDGDESELKDEWVMIYVSKGDKEYDNVNVVNKENQSYFYDFGGRQQALEQPERKFNKPEINLNDYHHIMDMIPAPKEEVSKPWWRFW